MNANSAVITRGKSPFGELPLVVAAIILTAISAVIVGLVAGAVVAGDVAPSPIWVAPFLLVGGYAFLRSDVQALPARATLSILDRAAIGMMSISMFAMT